MKETMRERLWKRYMARKGFEYNGYWAPEQCPDVRSDSVLALMEIVEELEKRFEAFKADVEAGRYK